MSARFTGSLGVVRVQVAPDVYLASLPMPIKDAKEWVELLSSDIARIGDASGIVGFPRGDELPCWFRARDVITVDVAPTEDPSA